VIKTAPPRVMSAISGLLGAIAVAAGLFGGRPLLGVLGVGLLALCAIAIVLSRNRTAGLKASLLSRALGPWTAFSLMTLVGALVTLLLGLAAIRGEELPLAIVLIPLGTLLLAAAVLGIRYSLLLQRESNAVRGLDLKVSTITTRIDEQRAGTLIGLGGNLAVALAGYKARESDTKAQNGCADFPGWTS
jgi:hypothetical protein